MSLSVGALLAASVLAGCGGCNGGGSPCADELKCAEACAGTADCACPGSAPRPTGDAGPGPTPRPGTDLAAFARGQAVFTRTFTAEGGLGPEYNGASCAECHSVPALGGEGDRAHRVYPNKGRFHVTAGEKTYPDSQPYLIPPPLFGLGYLDDVPDAEVRSGCGVNPARGIHGRAALSGQPMKTKAARFATKLLTTTTHAFCSGALTHEMGLNNFGDADELSDPQQPADISRADVDDVAAFVRGLEAPPPGPQDPAGRCLFKSIGCADCHRLDRRGTDLCLHDLGPALADDQSAQFASTRDWRTRPLMGVRFRAALMHDGRAGTSVSAAIHAHGGEAAMVVADFDKLSPTQQKLVIDFTSNL